MYGSCGFSGEEGGGGNVPPPAWSLKIGAQGPVKVPFLAQIDFSWSTQ